MEHAIWVLEAIIRGGFNGDDPQNCHLAQLERNELSELKDLLVELRDEAANDGMPDLSGRIQAFITGL